MYQTALNICDNLHIRSPYIELNETANSGTWIPERDTIFININLLLQEFQKGPRIPLITALAHELRHKWQSISGNSYTSAIEYYRVTELDSSIHIYGGDDMLESFKEYALQECELDANAFAYAYVKNMGYPFDDIDKQFLQPRYYVRKEIIDYAERFSF